MLFQFGITLVTLISHARFIDFVIGHIHKLIKRDQ